MGERWCFENVQKFTKQIIRILWTRRSLWVKLDGEEATGRVANTLDRSIIRIPKPHVPIRREGFLADSISVILACDDAMGATFP